MKTPKKLAEMRTVLTCTEKQRIKYFLPHKLGKNLVLLPDLGI